MDEFNSESFKSWQSVIKNYYDCAMEEIADAGLDRKEVSYDTMNLEAVCRWYTVVVEFIEDVYGYRNPPVEMVFNGNMPYDGWHTDSYESLKEEFSF